MMIRLTAPGQWLSSRLPLVAETRLPLLTASRVPLLAETALVERQAAPELVTPMAANPFFPGVPWLVPGPVAGAPYYA